MEQLSNRQFRKKVAASGAIILIAIAIPIMFENCSPSPSTSTTDASTLASTAPFAYNVAVDTLAYMSCDGEAINSYTPGQFWTFKAAALGQFSGLQISPAFIAAASSLGISDTADLQLAIEESSSAGAYPQLAIRVPSSPAGMQGYFCLLYNGACLNGADGNFLGGPIDSGNNLTNMLQANGDPWTNSFATNSGTTGFATTLDFTTVGTEGSGQFDANALRSYVGSGSGFLSVDFTNANYDTPPHGYALPGGYQNIYGEGFQFTFDGPSNHQVSGVTEFNLSTNLDQSDGTGWQCPYKLTIVRPGPDAQGTGSFPGGCASNPTSIPSNLIGTIQAMLPGWYVNWTSMCATPAPSTQGGLCYGGNQAGVIDYSNPATCSGENNTCPHYITICTRNVVL